MITPNMILTLPDVSTTPGPLWASQLNAALDLVDAHDHTTGHGALVPTAGLDINADLSFAAHSATDLFATIYVDQLGVTPSFASGVYVSQNDLWFKNGYGAAVQLTSGASIVGAGGTISGLPSLIAPTAGVAFDGSTGTYTFKKATNEAAILDVGPVTLRRTSAGSNGVTVTPASGTTSYTLTLPSAPPASVASLLGIATSGVLSNVAADTSLTITSSSAGVAANGIQTSHIANGAVTKAKQAAAGELISSSCGAYSRSAALDDQLVTNLSLTYNAATTRPILLTLQSAVGSAAGGFRGISALASSTISVYIQATGPSGNQVIAKVSLLTTNQFYTPTPTYAPSSVQAVFQPPSTGLYQFQVFANEASDGDIYFDNIRLAVVQF